MDFRIGTAISCANDSVETTEPNTNTEKPSDKPNKEEVNYDGTYPIELKLIPTKIITGDFSKVDLSKLQYLDDSLKLELANNCTMKTDGVEKKYNFYQFDIPEKLKGYFTGDPNTKIPIEGLIIAEHNKLKPKDKLDLVISDKGKIIKTDWNLVTYLGVFGEQKIPLLNLSFTSITLKDSKNKDYLYLSEHNKLAYVGTWEYKETPLLIKSITINPDYTASYNFGDTDKGELKVDFKKIGSVGLYKFSDKKELGKILKVTSTSMDFIEKGQYVTKSYIKKND